MKTSLKSKLKQKLAERRKVNTYYAAASIKDSRVRDEVLSMLGR